jgi:hypothetical protein
LREHLEVSARYAVRSEQIDGSSWIIVFIGGAKRDRTVNLYNAIALARIEGGHSQVYACAFSVRRLQQKIGSYLLSKLLRKIRDK